MQRVEIPGPSPPWEDYPEEKLLELRLCELGVQIQGSFLEPRIEQLFQELEKGRIRFRPHFWLSDDWFTPDGVSGSALPFYMAHPRLMALERSQMIEVEGGTDEWCMRILRHEAGHAIDNAYGLRRRKRRQRLFGKSTQTYPDSYSPKPYSKNYVRHLEPSYAQSHPDEDFAETFAVWLTPGSRWKTKYALWPVLSKIEYMDELMKDIEETEPRVTARRTVAPLSANRRTLREHYRKKQDLYQVDYPETYDSDLRRIFPYETKRRQDSSAASFLSRIRTDVRRDVANRTGVYQYTVDQLLQAMIARSRKLELRLSGSPVDAKFHFTNLLIVHTMEHIRAGRYRLAL